MKYINSQELLLVGTLGGAFIGALSSIFTTYIIKKFEEKKEYRKILLEAAITDWEKSNEIIIKSGKAKWLMPLDSYIIYHSKILNAVLGKKFSEKKLKQIFDESDKISELYQKRSKIQEEK